MPLLYQQTRGLQTCICPALSSKPLNTHRRQELKRHAILHLSYFCFAQSKSRVQMDNHHNKAKKHPQVTAHFGTSKLQSTYPLHYQQEQTNPVPLHYWVNTCDFAWLLGFLIYASLSQDDAHC